MSPAESNLRRIIAAELSQLSRKQLAALRGRTNAIADAILARARQSPDWPLLSAILLSL